MQFYSHLVVAHLLKNSCQPIDEDAYFLGSIIPDIRYYNGLPRETTHLSMASLDRYAHEMAHLKSFIDGYRLHCLIDEREQQLFNSIRSQFAIRLLNRYLSPFMLKMMVEVYFFDTHKLDLLLTDEQNEMLVSLGVETAGLAQYIKHLNHFLTHQTFESALETFDRLGVIGVGNADKYISAAKQIEKLPLLRPIIKRLVQNPLKEFIAKLENDFLKMI